MNSNRSTPNFFGLSLWTNLTIVIWLTTIAKINLSTEKRRRKRGCKTFLGVVKWKIKVFWPNKSGSAHETRVSGLAYRDDMIGDSRGYAHPLVLGPSKNYLNPMENRSPKQLKSRLLQYCRYRQWGTTRYFFNNIIVLNVSNWHK